MKMIKTFAYLIGSVAIIFGASSCKKDDDTRCCTATYDGDKMTVCEDDQDFKDWQEYAEYFGEGTSWSDFTDMVQSYYSDASCD